MSEAPFEEEETSRAFLCAHASGKGHVSTHGEVTACTPEWGSCQNLIMLALILDFQNFEKINVLFKPASLWYLVMAAWVNQNGPLSLNLWK